MSAIERLEDLATRTCPRRPQLAIRRLRARGSAGPVNVRAWGTATGLAVAVHIGALQVAALRIGELHAAELEQPQGAELDRDETTDGPAVEPQVEAASDDDSQDAAEGWGWNVPRVAPMPPGIRLGAAEGLAFGMAAGQVPGGELRAFGGGNMIQLEIGAQLSGRWALFARGEASTVLIANQAAGYALAEYHFSDLFFLYSGLGYEVMASWSAFEDSALCFECVRESWGGLAVPWGIGLTWPEKIDEVIGLREYARGTLGGAVGVEPSTGVVGWHVSFTIGVTLIPAID